MYNYCYTNELYHHGIKGQRWGIRRFQNADGSYTAAGKNRYGFDNPDRKKMGFTDRMLTYNAQRTASRLNNMSRERKARMSSSQRRSYEMSKKYWNARAQNKRPTEDRNIVKRTYDMWRAKNAASRTSIYAAQTAYQYATRSLALTGEVDVKDIAKTTAVATGSSMVTDELLARIFGHY